MEHVVFFPAPDGTPAFRRFAGLEEAVRFVEHLRNVENVSSASVYSLTEVPLSFKAWYRVEVPGEASEASEAAEAVEAPSAPADEVAPVRRSRCLPPPSRRRQPPGPGTIAEAIESYSLAEAPGVPTFEVPDQGSATGIVVPDQPLVAVDQFTMPAPSVLPGPSVLPAPEQPATAPTPVVAAAPEGDAQVLEPVFGARRERGIGFFAR